MFEIFEQCLPQFTFCLDSYKRQQIDTLPLIAIAFVLELSSVQATENVHFLSFKLDATTVMTRAVLNNCILEIINLVQLYVSSCTLG